MAMDPANNARYQALLIMKMRMSEEQKDSTSRFFAELKVGQQLRSDIGVLAVVTEEFKAKHEGERE